VRLGGCLLILVAAASAAAAADALRPYRVDGDAIPERFAPMPGDAARGKAVVTGRDSNCLLCHAVPDSGVRAMGNLGPPLAGVGARFSEGQLRLRIVDSLRLNPDSIMPVYYRIDGLNRVAREQRGKPVLTAQQVEDTVAYLATLR
jgi:sulfur-oxidizing protein SoxX